MNKTKRRALDTALLLFNRDGISKVALRTIALEMGISQGNLAFHFKKREDIVEALYFELVDKMDHTMNRVDEDENLIRFMYTLNESIMYDFFQYRFLLIDFVYILRENKTIKQHYLQLIKLREVQFSHLFQELVDSGLMREELIENEYDNLFIRFQILGNFWLPTTILLSETMNNSLVKKYAKIILESILPYLTPRGLLLFDKLN